MVPQKSDPRLVLAAEYLLFTIYMPYWFMSRRKALNALDARPKIHPIFIAAAWASQLGAAYFAVLKALDILPAMAISNAVLAWLTVVVLQIKLTFMTRTILADHSAANHMVDPKTGQPFEFSRLWTLLLGYAFLQHRINQMFHPAIATVEPASAA